MFCRFCATLNKEGSTHCRVCSAPLSPAPEPAAAAPTVPQMPAVSPWAEPLMPVSAPRSQPQAQQQPPPRPQPQAPPQAQPSQAPSVAVGNERTLAQVLASRGGALGDAESLRYVEAVARALALELGRGRAPVALDPERILMKADGGIALNLEWQDLGQSARAVESHLAHELERLSQRLRGQGSVHGGSHPNAQHAGQRRGGSDAAARAHIERVEHIGFFDTARDMMRGALSPIAVPPGTPSRPASQGASSPNFSSPNVAPRAAGSEGAPNVPASSSDTSDATELPRPQPAPRKEAAPPPPPVKLDFDKVKAQIVRTWSRGKAFTKIGWAREGRELWTVDDEGVLSVWNIETGTCNARMEARFRGAAVCSVAFLGREELVATGHEDGRLCLWMPRANRLRASLEAHQGRISSLCFATSTTGRTRLFSGGGDGTLRAWDALEGKSVGTEVEVTPLNVRESSAAPDGERVALGGDGGRIEVWRQAAGRMEWSSALHQFWITSLAFSPDGRVLASGGYDRAVRLWSGASGALGREFKVHESFVSALRWSAGSDLLFSLSCDGALWMHDWKGSRSRQIASEDGMQDFILHPDGRHFAAASRDGLSLWRLE